MTANKAYQPMHQLLCLFATLLALCWTPIHSNELIVYADQFKSNPTTKGLYQGDTTIFFNLNNPQSQGASESKVSSNGGSSSQFDHSENSLVIVRDKAPDDNKWCNIEFTDTVKIRQRLNEEQPVTLTLLTDFCFFAIKPLTNRPYQISYRIEPGEKNSHQFIFELALAPADTTTQNEEKSNKKIVRPDDNNQASPTEILSQYMKDVLNHSKNLESKYLKLTEHLSCKKVYRLITKAINSGDYFSSFPGHYHSSLLCDVKHRRFLKQIAIFKQHLKKNPSTYIMLFRKQYYISYHSAFIKENHSNKKSRENFAESSALISVIKKLSSDSDIARSH